MKKPGGLLDHRAFETFTRARSRQYLDDTEYDGADKGEGEIGRPHTQPVDESHGNAPLVHVTARINALIYQTVPAPKKSALLSGRPMPHRTSWLKTREINVLMSP